ncbi:N-acetyl-gamma-glutamyl-phosphate reductase [Leptobacterium flavescens]|uniref:N-acetyl-gamma-glutamyl-phosphate reductase n=1 Tax=Leptobacterium flavescens TaxID=472055 RepID=A0A6P0UP36_9FLAO|nr:N-acetyl-gamma-glutamyl-phosphate reductase [Leptobacterium flavescens]NER14747.1 N-acetyl-gamma-glutamyl-phosphate reductase [Leptobacterium flavescens]
MIKAGIIGGTGYTAGELIRILSFHPQVEIDFIMSTTKAGEAVSDVHQDMLGLTDLHFTDTVNTGADVIFLCLGHGNSKKILQEHSFSSHTRIIDLSNDFRLKEDSNFNGMPFVYGLPELQKKEIKNAAFIANPGCFATAIQLALLPLAGANMLHHKVHINAITGSTGAGGKLSSTAHYSWRNNNISWYKPFTHQHLGEIGQSLQSLQKKEASLFFLPQRGNFTRGIFATAYTEFEGSPEKAFKLYDEFYKDAAFTHVSKKEIQLKQVVNTNKAHIHLHKHDNTLLVTSVIDNLLKGASGQAVQNMNLMFGLDEKEGLQLKGSFF